MILTRITILSLPFAVILCDWLRHRVEVVVGAKNAKSNDQ
jgi:hypothetical protein